MAALTLPAPRTPDPMTAPSLRWGIVGTGWIAERFVTSLRDFTTQGRYAVASSRPSSARDFAARMGMERAHAGVDDLLADPRVDVVYVATPHHTHEELALRAIAAGKPVLIEKPLGINGVQARRIADRAREAGVFAMEALWSLCLPKFDVLRQLIDDGRLGEVHTVLADIGEFFNSDHRILRRELAGGAMLDLGTYPVALATWLLGKPSSVAAVASQAPSGVTAQTGMLLTYAGGAQAILHASLASGTPNNGVVTGSRGLVVLDAPFYHPGGLTFTDRDGHCGRYDEPRIGHLGLCYEAAEVARCVTAGLLESPLRPLTDSVSSLEVMDAVRVLTADSFDME